MILFTEKYWSLLNRRCSPDVCQKLVEQEIDFETFIMLSKAEFISLGISRSDASILKLVQHILKEQLLDLSV
ncbi:unnamed protein product [Gongylonema pulchrum]|uniref:SAM domain-containing protein n=1 Tax=Gongylonema pulchrum TaxID=637853 RepID=A0A183DB08_9BILA|nr:unnamed protein product [Gongylonema pulchrum]